MWKDVVGFEGIYEINEFGDIRNAIDKTPRKFYITNKGYKAIDLSKNGKKSKFLIHRLVAMHFVPNPEGYPIVLHNDNVKTNTHYSNLRWGTYSENNAQAIRDGLNKVPRPDNRKMYEIYNENGEFVRCYGTQEIIDTIGFGNDQFIRNHLHRKTPIRKGQYQGYRLRNAIIRDAFKPL